MKHPLVLAGAAAAMLCAATAAEAGRVDWSIGINVPPVSAVVAGPGYGGAAYYGPASYGPAYYGPGYGSGYYSPGRYAPPARYYEPRGRYLPAPVYVRAPAPRLWLPPLPPLPPLPRFFRPHDRHHFDGHVDYRR